MKVSDQELADLVYESAMYKLSFLDIFRAAPCSIEELWESIEIVPDGQIEKEEYKEIEKSIKPARPRKIKLDYKR